MTLEPLSKRNHDFTDRLRIQRNQPVPSGQPPVRKDEPKTYQLILRKLNASEIPMAKLLCTLELGKRPTESTQQARLMSSARQPETKANRTGSRFDLIKNFSGDDSVDYHIKPKHNLFILPNISLFRCLSLKKIFCEFSHFSKKISKFRHWKAQYFV
jgi:hypothetical protein